MSWFVLQSLETDKLCLKRYSMDLTYRLAGKREYLSEGEKMEDFKKRTAKMQRIMKKREAEIRDFIYEIMSKLEEDHKTIFTVEERGLVEIPQFVGFLTWPDQKVTTVRTAFYYEGTHKFCILYIMKSYTVHVCMELWCRDCECDCGCSLQRP